MSLLQKQLVFLHYLYVVFKQEPKNCFALSQNTYIKVINICRVNLQCREMLGKENENLNYFIALDNTECISGYNTSLPILLNRIHFFQSSGRTEN